MIRVVGFTGQLLQGEKVVPVCEKKVPFNGKEVVMMQAAKDFSVGPTAIAMLLPKRQSMEFPEKFLVGNLKTEQVMEIIRELGEKEYFDFSKLPRQEADTLEKIVMDKGKSGAYSSETVSELKYECIGIDSEFCLPRFPLGRPAFCAMNDPAPEMCWEDLDQN